MRIRLRSFLSVAWFSLAFGALGCSTGDEDLQASAVPTTTGIPIGAPGAVGASLDPLPRAAIAAPPPHSEGIEQKINPTPHSPDTGGKDPIIPPSPFGTPTDPDDDDHPPVTTKKKPKGTKI